MSFFSPGSAKMSNSSQFFSGLLLTIEYWADLTLHCRYLDSAALPRCHLPV